MTASDLHDRQVRLAEVGAAGQARIERFRAVVRGKDGDGIERAYLERAGALSVASLPEEPPAAFVHAAAFHFDAPRRVGAGACRALAQLRAALEVGSP
jgi:hypothetical protein